MYTLIVLDSLAMDLADPKFAKLVEKIGDRVQRALTFECYERGTFEKCLNSMLSDNQAFMNAVCQNLRQWAEEKAIGNLKDSMRKCETDDQLIQLKQDYAFASSPFRSRVVSDIANELDTRNQMRAKLAWLWGALNTMQSPQELRDLIGDKLTTHSYYNDGYDAVRNQIMRVMSGSESPSSVAPNLPLWLEKHMNISYSEIYYRVFRLCKDQATPSLVEKALISRSWAPLCPPPHRLNMNLLLSKIYDGDSIAFFAAFDKGVESYIQKFNKLHCENDYLIIFEGVMALIQALDPIETDLFEKIRDKIVRAKIMRDIIFWVNPEIVVTWALYRFKKGLICKATVEELLPTFIHRVKHEYMDENESIYVSTVLDETMWDTHVMKIAVQRHVDPSPLHKRRRILNMDYKL